MLRILFGKLKFHEKVIYGIFTFPFQNLALLGLEHQGKKTFIPVKETDICESSSETENS